MRSLGPLMGALTPAGVAADGGAYLDKLAELTDGRVGITGYCFGGRLGWTIAAAHPDRVAAVGGFHTGRHGHRQRGQPAPARAPASARRSTGVTPTRTRA